MAETIWKVPHESGATLVGWNQPSILLEGNAAGVSALRPHRAFVPPSKPGQRFPVIYYLAPWTHAGRAAFQWEAFKEDLASRLMRLISSGRMQPCVVVSPDLYTDYGGSQFINSEWVGPHARHIVSEVIPFVEEHLPVLCGPKHRGVFGRSSGGFGALRLAMDFPGLFSAVGCHSGDMGFDWVYRRSLIDLCTGLAKFQDPARYLVELKNQKKLSGWDTHILMLLGVAAFFSPNLASPYGFDLPIHLQTAEINEQVYGRWLANDPLVKASDPGCQESLRQLTRLFIDCGNRDQYFLQYGSRRLSQRLNEAGIGHIYQEFDDNHSGTVYRFDESLPYLVTGLM